MLSLTESPDRERPHRGRGVAARVGLVPKGRCPHLAQPASAAGVVEADHLVRAHLGFRLRRRLRRRPRARAAGGVVAIGLVLSGPLACGTSQAVNDWYDRHVDAINEPNRPIPSGRVPGQWGFGIAVGWTILTAAVAFLLGAPVVLATATGLILAWIYSAPPIRLKRNGWWSNLAVGISYEGLPWFAGAAVCLRAMPSASVIVVALIYSLGAHGIMTLNDFKSIEGDRQMGLGSLPARLGPDRACRLACITMGGAQAAIVVLLLVWRMPIHACIVVALLAAQLALMVRLLEDPRGRAPLVQCDRAPRSMCSACS